MRANSIMKYIIFGAVGLGIGWAVAGFFNVALVGITSPMVQPGPGELPGWYLWTDYLPQWAYCFAGACGGAGLGLAMGGWKWAVTLAVAGGIGLGFGLFLLFVVAFLFGLHPVGMAAPPSPLMGEGFRSWHLLYEPRGRASEVPRTVLVLRSSCPVLLY